MKYMIGQRVIYRNVICTICKPELEDKPGDIWIYNPERDHQHQVKEKNLKPLPGGQL